MRWKKKIKAFKRLKPLNSEIQICPICSKVDVYKDDNHNCVAYQANAMKQ